MRSKVLDGLIGWVLIIVAAVISTSLVQQLSVNNYNLALIIGGAIGFIILAVLATLYSNIKLVMIEKNRLRVK